MATIEDSAGTVITTTAVEPNDIGGYTTTVTTSDSTSTTVRNDANEISQTVVVTDGVTTITEPFGDGTITTTQESDGTESVQITDADGVAVDGTQTTSTDSQGNDVNVLTFADGTVLTTTTDPTSGQVVEEYREYDVAATEIVVRATASGTSTLTSVVCTLNGVEVPYGIAEFINWQQDSLAGAITYQAGDTIFRLTVSEIDTVVTAPSLPLEVVDARTGTLLGSVGSPLAKVRVRLNVLTDVVEYPGEPSGYQLVTDLKWGTVESASPRQDPDKVYYPLEWTGSAYRYAGVEIAHPQQAAVTATCGDLVLLDTEVWKLDQRLGSVHTLSVPNSCPMEAE